MTRRIIHLDLDAFYCAVEERNNPALQGKPFAVGGKPDSRGVVSSCSYAARRFGVRSAMPMSKAVRICPELIVISGKRKEYGKASREVMDILHQVTPLVEQISIDEAFLDVSDMLEPVEQIARNIQLRIRDELQLPSSVGIASNKMVAKIATEIGKKAAGGSGPPFGLTSVPAGQEAEFLHPLPAEMLWGVGAKTASRLAALGIHTIGDITRWPEDDLIRRFGEHGRDLARHAKGIDNRPVFTEHEIKSVSQELTFAHDIADEHTLERTLSDLAAQVGQRLRKQNLAGTTVRLKIRWSDFTTLTRQITLPTPTNQDDQIAVNAISLMKKVRQKHQRVRLIGVGVSNLAPPIRQLGLWDEALEKNRHLQSVLDELRERYGDSAIRKGVKVKKR